jgi:hypothetical protein
VSFLKHSTDSSKAQGPGGEHNASDDPIYEEPDGVSDPEFQKEQRSNAKLGR